MASPWMTAREAAQYLRLFRRDGAPSVDALDKYVAIGEITVHRMGPGKRAARRFHRDDLDAFLDRYCRRVPEWVRRTA